MDDGDIARWRLRSQFLGAPRASAADVVGGLLAVQAENPGQAGWAVAARTLDRDPADLAILLDDGSVVRTHVLRPTWHFARAEGIGWLLDLTGPRVQRITGQQLRVTHGLEEREIDRATSAITDALAARGRLTRAQLVKELAQRGVALQGTLPMILLAHIELGGLVCSGGLVGGEHTYALMQARVRGGHRLAREEALAELALRYFCGHGPATEKDLAYWATLTLTDVRLGLALSRDRLSSFEHAGRTFWHAPGESPPIGPVEPAAHLLQILDEMYRGYQDSRWVVDAESEVPRVREVATGMALVDGQLVGAVRRTVADRRVTFDLRPHRPLSDHELDAVRAAAERYGAFLEREVRLRVDTAL